MSKVVFVGNVPYTKTEEDLIEVFKSVGQVVAFRLLYDRDTGKPKGYGFCEFADHETALSAVRNLNGTDVGGRPLRIDLADSDPSLEGRTTVRGELVDSDGSRSSGSLSSLSSSGSFSSLSSGGSSMSSLSSGGGSQDDLEISSFLSTVPDGKDLPRGMSSLDAISKTLATMPPGHLLEVLAQMKAFTINHPTFARALLVANPQLAYALFQALLLCNIVDEGTLKNMIAPPPSQFPPVQMQPDPYGIPTPPQSRPGSQTFSAPIPPSSQPLPASFPAPSSASFYPTPPQVAPPTPADANMSDEQRIKLMQVLNMTPEQINATPEPEQSAIRQLRVHFGITS